jgi:Kef-type K+ transport system membrane component KefB
VELVVAGPPLGTLGSLLVIVLAAALAPVLVDLRPAWRVPLVVAEITLGVAVGPQVLGWATADALIEFLSQLGMAFLFFLAGLELDFGRVRGAPLRLAGLGWLLSVGLALALAWALERAGVVVSGVLVGVALTTTALGALVPLLRDSGELGSPFGGHAVAVGVAGEFGPILLTALLLAPGNRLVTAALLAGFVLCALATAALALRARPPRLVRLLGQTMHTSAQLAVRVCLLLLVALAALAARFGLDVLLGAFTAGLIVSLASTRAQAGPLREKLEGIGFGFLIPLFFVATGIRFDLRALLEGPQSLLRLPVFLALFLVVRGLPVLLLYRRALPRPDRVPLALLAATALPTVVALSELGLRTARLRPETAAALVGAALLSVFLYPLGALALRRAGWTAVGSAAARGGRESDSATARPPGATAGRRVAPPLARRSRIVERTNGLPPALGGGSALT